MDRQYIQDNQVIERYLAGRLTKDEEAAFEEAYLEHPDILDELQAAERLREAIKRSNLADPVGAQPKRQGLGVFGSRWYSAAASVLLVVTLAYAGTLYRENLMLRAQSSAQGSFVTRLVPLVSVRGGEPNAIEPPAENELTVLLLDAGTAELDSYRAVLERLSDGAPEVVWSRDGLQPTYDGMIAVGLPGPLLRPGRYVARLEGRMADWPPQRFEEISSTSFTVGARD